MASATMMQEAVRKAMNSALFVPTIVGGAGFAAWKYEFQNMARISSPALVVWHAFCCFSLLC